MLVGQDGGEEKEERSTVYRCKLGYEDKANKELCREDNHDWTVSVALKGSRRSGEPANKGAANQRGPIN